ncbi:MAG: TlpA disulfide reductase family protein [Planctomycetia bacterium]|nr:TlpA disulfide reductase family protein [Planctomycetia bacterium]
MPMNSYLKARVLRGCACVACLALVYCTPIFAQTPDAMLKRAPSQADVDYDIPAEQDVANCQTKRFTDGDMTCVGLYAPDGTTLLRAWCAPKDGAQRVEQIRFYKNGMEVFRDVVGKEVRWVNVGGSRRGTLGADKKSVGEWLSISAEETSQEVLAALKTGDFARFQRVALNAVDLAKLGLSGALATEAQNQVKGVTADAFAKLAQTLAIPADATWGALNANQPATVPASGSNAQDLHVYYNAAVVVMKNGDNTQSQELYIGDLVKIGDVWKVLGLPTGEPFGKATGAVAASSVFVPVNGANAAGEASADMVELGAVLSEAYRKLEGASAAEYPAALEQTVQTFLSIAESNPQQRDEMIGQAVDLVFTGVQQGMYPNGVKKLQELADAYNDNASVELKARIRQRQITVNYYAVAQAQPQPKPAELTKAQERYTEDLASFVDEFANTQAGAEAAMTLGLDQEYMLDSDAAIQYYQKAAQSTANPTLSQKARGAIERLRAEGKTSIKIPATTYFGGGACDLNALLGKPTLVFFWGSWDQESVNAVKAIASQVNVVGVNVDTAPDPQSADAYYKQILQGVPWKNVCDPAGFEGTLPVALGVQTAPWVILIDKTGKVVRSNIANLEELPDIIKELK